MVIQTVIWPSFYADCPSYHNRPHLPELGIGTDDHCPEADDLMRRPGFELGSSHQIPEMVDFEIQGYNHW